MYLMADASVDMNLYDHGQETSDRAGAVPEKKITGSSFVSVSGITPKGPPKLLSCSYSVQDMHVKFGKQFTHYLILFQELESNKKKFEF